MLRRKITDENQPQHRPQNAARTCKHVRLNHITCKALDCLKYERTTFYPIKSRPTTSHRIFRSDRVTTQEERRWRDRRWHLLLLEPWICLMLLNSCAMIQNIPENARADKYVRSRGGAHFPRRANMLGRTAPWRERGELKKTLWRQYLKAMQTIHMFVYRSHARKQFCRDEQKVVPLDCKGRNKTREWQEQDWEPHQLPPTESLCQPTSDEWRQRLRNEVHRCEDMLLVRNPRKNARLQLHLYGFQLNILC